MTHILTIYKILYITFIFSAVIGITKSRIDNSISDSEVRFSTSSPEQLLKISLSFFAPLLYTRDEVMKFHATAFFDAVGTEMWEELHVMLGRIYVLI